MKKVVKSEVPSLGQKAQEWLKKRPLKNIPQYAELYNFAPSSYFTLSKEGNIIRLNLSGSQMLGKDRTDLINSRFSLFVSDETRPIFNHFLGKVLSSKTKETCEVTLSVDSHFPVEVQLSGIVSGNGENCLITAVETFDIKKIAELNKKELQRKNEELCKINGEKDKFFSIIAHDLRSPFNGFLGLTELMADGLSHMAPEEIQKTAMLMRNSAANLFRLLGNLLEWSRLQMGLATFNPDSILLMPEISEIMVLVLEAANKKGITVSYELPHDLIVYTDVNMLEVIIRNLVTNAVKFTPKGGNITVSAKYLPDMSVEIAISDKGIGMSKKIMDNLFRLDVNTNRKGTDGEYSTGLGLIICKDLVEKHGGKLWVESEEGKGSTFYFSLPANPYREKQENA